MQGINKKYQIIYADPPWMETGGGKIKRGADAHYPLMKTKDICALPVKNISDENCHLYIWATNNFLYDAMEVIKAWGFKYKTIITWEKDRIGLGQYFRGKQNIAYLLSGGIFRIKLQQMEKDVRVKQLFMRQKQNTVRSRKKCTNLLKKYQTEKGLKK